MPLNIKPPLLNSANPWCTTKQDLQELYDSPFTGAVTTRTSLLAGFDHDPTIHQHLYFDARSNEKKSSRSPMANSTLNTLGYSPFPLSAYLDWIPRIVAESPRRGTRKPWVISVTGTAEEIVECHGLIAHCARSTSIPLLMEVNLSCPNIVDRPPPAYSALALEAYLFALQRAPSVRGDVLDSAGNNHSPSGASVSVGIKIPPYTWSGQFATLIDALLATTAGGMTCPVQFVTACNTLGNCLVLDEAPHQNYVPALGSASGTGIGGMGGSALHPLALGNVRMLRTLLDAHEVLRGVAIIGVGGVGDYAGYERMKSVGAAAVAVGTALGRDGVEVFEKISNEADTISKLNGSR